ncbi:MAG: hypothetical protein IKU65_04015 [Oscillospiraceae bacterium]|nr:hypothetical protein [Oscillospiraceae bacterium]
MKKLVNNKLTKVLICIMIYSCVFGRRLTEETQWTVFWIVLIGIGAAILLFVISWIIKEIFIHVVKSKESE